MLNSNLQAYRLRKLHFHRQVSLYGKAGLAFPKGPSGESQMPWMAQAPTDGADTAYDNLASAAGVAATPGVSWATVSLRVQTPQSILEETQGCSQEGGALLFSNPRAELNMRKEEKLNSPSPQTCSLLHKPGICGWTAASLPGHGERRVQLPTKLSLLLSRVTRSSWFAQDFPS